MFLFRIGKEKWAYTLTMSIYKIKYSDMSSLTQNHQIKIDNRGNHELTYLSTINKQGQIVPDKNARSILMTLFYDKDEKKFDRKEMTIQGKILDQYNDVETQLGQAELDIAQYAKEEGAQNFILEAELNNYKRICKIKFKVTIERNLDVKKENIEATTQNLSEKEEKRSRVSVDKPKNKLKESSIKQLTSRQEEKSEKASILSLPLQLSKPTQRFQKTLSRNIIKPPKEQPSNRQYNDLDFKQFSHRSSESEKLSEDNDTVVLCKNTPPKLVNQSSTAYSTELKLYEAQKRLKMKQQQVERLKKMLEDQQKINLVLAEQQRKQYNYQESTKFNKQLTKMRAQLQVANMKISQLESSNRNYLDQLERNQLSSDKMGQQIAYYKLLLEQEKLKVAQLFQKVLETGDSDLITLVEETFAKE